MKRLFSLGKEGRKTLILSFCPKDGETEEKEKKAESEYDSFPIFVNWIKVSRQLKKQFPRLQQNNRKERVRGESNTGHSLETIRIT